MKQVFTMEKICSYSLIPALILILSISCTTEQRTVRSPAEIRNGELSLVTDDPMENSVRLFSYLQSIYGKKTLAGQMDLTWNDSVNMITRVYKDTGKYPAIQGFDFMNLNGRSSGTMQTYEAMAWWKDAAGTGKNGIVTFCWHWRNPMKPFDRGEFYTRRTGFRIPYDIKKEQWKTDTPEYSALLRDIDRAAAELKKLEKQGVPVLWRPLHEASGGWFWWGASTGKSYLALWNLLFEQLNTVHGLKNLIWVWNAQDADWYPGDDKVDIIGEDIYAPPRNYDSHKSRFYMASRISHSGKMIALTENGAIPHPDNMGADNSRWLYFMTWNDAKGAENRDAKDSFWTGEYHNENIHKREVYNHGDVITLDELPLFTQDNSL